MDTTPIENILAEAVKRVPQNEALVCQCVIVPTLEALGYQKWDIIPQASDSNNQFPDFTVLPDSDHTWYLEAKGWQVRLEDRFAIQALNYANHNGRRWVVLTNGQTWRLYDNHIHEQADGKMVVEASINQPAMLMALLEALSPTFVQRGLDRFVTVARLQLYIAGEIERENSEIIRGVLKIVRKQSGMGGATAADIVQILTGLQSSDDRTNDVVPTPSRLLPHPGSPSEASDSPPSTASLNGVALGHLVSHPELATGNKPTTVSLPDGTVESATSWADLAQHIVAWTVASGRCPAMPFNASRKATGTKRSFVNDAPHHPDGVPMKGHRAVPTEAGTLYIDTNRSASLFLTSLVALCDAVGVPPSEIRITIG